MTGCGQVREQRRPALIVAALLVVVGWLLTPQGSPGAPGATWSLVSSSAIVSSAAAAVGAHGPATVAQPGPVGRVDGVLRPASAANSAGARTVDHPAIEGPASAVFGALVLFAVLSGLLRRERDDSRLDGAAARAPPVGLTTR